MRPKVKHWQICTAKSGFAAAAQNQLTSYYKWPLPLTYLSFCWDFYKSQARDALLTNGNVPPMGGALFFFGTTARQH